MRNINFDESLVLRELSRIAHEEDLLGLKKTAATKTAEETKEPVPGPEKVETKVDEYGADLVSRFPEIHKLYAGKSFDASKLVKELPAFLKSDRFYSQSEEMKEGYDKTINMIKAKLQKPLAIQYKKVVSKYGENQPYAKMLGSLLEMLKQASEKVQMTKQAKGEHYDVTDETGEDLVEKAHPGGGTKTELTHSKTDENLVETIVEQQEKDLEVARKAPKGTYAALADLYLDLKKMGHGDKLSDLKACIQSIATPEEVTEHTLVTLADKLDLLGHKKHANAVDKILTKLAQPPRSTIEFGEDEVDVIKPGLTKEEFREQERLHREQQKREKKKRDRLHAHRQAVRLFQHRYNRMLGLEPGDQKYLKEDGILGPRTKRAIRDPEYLKLQRGYSKPKEQGEKVKLEFRPQDAKEHILQAFKAKFPRFDLKYAPELDKAFNSWARDLAQYKPEEAKEQAKNLVKRLTPEDIKQYVKFK